MPPPVDRPIMMPFPWPVQKLPLASSGAVQCDKLVSAVIVVKAYNGYLCTIFIVFLKYPIPQVVVFRCRIEQILYRVPDPTF